jgi:Ulp1 family protease
MLKERDELMCDKVATRKPSHFFSTHFVTRMLGPLVNQYDYPGVKRWTKKFDVFSYDKIFFPINIRNKHWTLLVVYVQESEIIYYDSINGAGDTYLKRFMQWVKDESREKNGMTIDENDWTLRSQLNCVPQQNNGCDCGVFSIICADFISDDLPLSYSQNDMLAFRIKIAAAIIRGSLNYALPR